MTRNEPWAENVEVRMDPSFRVPHHRFDLEARKGAVHLPLHEDPLVLADWLAHEIGHLVHYLEQPPSDWQQRMNELAYSERVPKPLRGPTRLAYRIRWWRERVAGEIAANREAIRLLQKIGVSPSLAMPRGLAAARALEPPTPWYAFLQRHYERRLNRERFAQIERTVNRPPAI